ncbi:MAG: hypothetical protein A2Y62_20645 [Candidatus Fischerbacteria bacterium RBG_13_37_8]|uniref:non-specific serine/threonine protein kinase n=1 Tax=Candidatus Fischerbacteria bacterium RBG_13_37_8 TaxID=1817863 RepID=A0A1F5VEF5_9BACT|nr:MAG: hypothetical protein A2Y62_20645 [Candidatus Fischerbacteria bacterium RBG_13_37_8]
MNKSELIINPSTRILLKERSYVLDKTIGENDLYEIWQGTRNIFSISAGSDIQRRRYRIYLLKSNAEHNTFVPDIEAVKDEVRLLSYIYHKNCPYIEDAGEINLNNKKTFFFTEHWWEGISLRDVFLQAKTLSTASSKFYMPIGVALWTLREIADALDHIHNLKDDAGHPLNIVHRDIKPDNIFYTREGKIIIAGFSSSKSTINLYHTMAGQIRGVSPYMAPERLLSSDTIDGCKADIFSLGCVLFEMIAGFPRMRITTAGLPDFDSLQRKVNLQALRPTVHNRLENLIYKMTSYDADHRFETADELRDEIDILLDASPYRCFVGDIAGFIRYVIDRDQDGYLAIQRLIEREHKFPKNNKKKKNIILQSNQSVSKQIHSVSTPQVKNILSKTESPHVDYNEPVSSPDKKNLLSHEQWTDIQRRLNEVMETNKTQRIEKSKVLVLSVAVLLVLVFICLIVWASIFFKKNNSTFSSVQSNTASSAPNAESIMITDDLLVNKDYLLNKKNGTLSLQISILRNAAVAFQLRSIDGVLPEAKDTIIKHAYQNVQETDWSPYVGRSFTYTYTLVGQ